MALFNKALPPVAGKPRGGQWSGMMKIDGSNGRRYMGEVTLGWWFWGLISMSPVQSVGTFFSFACRFKITRILLCLFKAVLIWMQSVHLFGYHGYGFRKFKYLFWVRLSKAWIYLLPQIGCTCQATFLLHLSYKQKSQEKGGRWLIPLPPFTPGEQVHTVSACWLIFFFRSF